VAAAPRLPESGTGITGRKPQIPREPAPHEGRAVVGGPSTTLRNVANGPSTTLLRNVRNLSGALKPGTAPIPVALAPSHHDCAP
jgi:hypothetical protein